MIIKTEVLQDVANKILASVDDNILATLTETVELITKGRTLYFNITNKEYFVSVKFEMETEEELHASVNANLFLKLINKTTTENIELTISDNCLNVVGNGNYKIPLTMDADGNLLTLPNIDLDNVTTEMSISYDVLNSIISFNSKELNRGLITKPVQKLYYIDEEGCITFTQGACVNNFTLSSPIRLLLNDRVVKLFKLFKGGDVNFKLAYDPISETIIQTKVEFTNENVQLKAITGCDEMLLNQVPVKAIRGRANKSYPYSAVFNKNELIEAVDRLLLFNVSANGKENLKPYSECEFKEDSVVIFDTLKNQKEVISYQVGSNVDEDYSMFVDLADFKKILDSCVEPLVTVHFGDGKAFVISRGRVKNVAPEVVNKAQ